MLKGDLIELRLAREEDLGALYELMADLESRGAYFPLGVTSEPALRAQFAKNGFWDQLFGSRHAGKGYTSEAVDLLTRYLFGRKRVNRMQLNIHPECGVEAGGRQVRLHVRADHARLLVPRRRVPGSGGLVAAARQGVRCAGAGLDLAA